MTTATLQFTEEQEAAITAIVKPVREGRGNEVKEIFREK